MQSFCHFFLMNTPSTNKTNKFIPYHLIISKTKYHRIKRYIFHDLLMHFSFCDVRVFYDVWVLRHISMDAKSTQYFNQWKSLLHEKLNDLRNEFIFFVCGWKYPSEKKWRETASLRVAHDAKFPSFFSDGYSIHKQNK